MKLQPWNLSLKLWTQAYPKPWGINIKAQGFDHQKPTLGLNLERLVDQLIHAAARNLSGPVQHHT